MRFSVSQKQDQHLIINAIRLAEKIMKKACGLTVDLELMLVDFLRVYDSIKRNKLVSALVEINLDRKLIKLIKMTIKSATV